MSYSGWLKKKGKNQGLWHKRHVKLSRSSLTISKEANNTSVEQVLPINNETLVTILPDASTPRFQIQVKGEPEPVLFTGPTNEEVKRWVGAIQASINPTPKLSMDHFRILSVIGKGFYGKVMLVQKIDNGELYAIKSIRKARLLESGMSDSIVAERNIMMKMQHPFIVTLHFAFQTETKFYLGLEYAPGGELFYYMGNVGVVPLNDARLYIAEIGLALSHLHSHGIVYRDLKPENILFDSEGHIKLTDFGLSKDLLKTDTATTFCGTSEYLAPEIILKQPYKYSIDEWALGVLTYEMLFGIPPFSDDNRSTLFKKIVEEEPFFPEGTDPRVMDFISKLLEKDPTSRPTFDSMRTHPLFEGFDWDKVYNKEYSPSFVPTVHDNKVPVNFDPEFTSEMAADSFVQSTIGEIGNIQGFSFVDTNVLDFP